VVSCGAVSSIKSSLPSASIPSSNYPVDIIGHVTIANEVIANGTEDVLQPGVGWWIVQVSIRNKSYQSPITSKSELAIVFSNNPSNLAGVAIDLVQNSSVSISSGETGELMLGCLAPNGITPSQCQISLWSGSNGISFGNLVATNTAAEIYNWDLQKITQIGTSPVSTSPIVQTPSGTYTLTAMGIKQTATFKSNHTLEINDPVEGKNIFTYSISGNGQWITLTNIVTNETGTEAFKYVPAANCVVLNNLEYYK